MWNGFFQLVCCTFLVADLAAGPIVVTGARIIDGTGRPPTENGAVVMEGNRIVAVGPMGEVTFPHDAEKVDATGKRSFPD